MEQGLGQASWDGAAGVDWASGMRDWARGGGTGPGEAGTGPGELGWGSRRRLGQWDEGLGKGSRDWATTEAGTYGEHGDKKLG